MSRASVMVDAVSDLSRRLADAKGDRSIDDIVRQAENRGHPINRSVVARYVRGDHGPNTRPATIEALAAGFGLDPREVRELAGRPAGELGAYVPTPEAASLTEDQRAAIDQLIKVFVKGGRNGGQEKTDGPAADGGADELERRRQAAAKRRQDPSVLAAHRAPRTNADLDADMAQAGEENQDLGSDEPS